MIWLVIPIHFIQFVKFWSSWSFVKSRWLWVRRTHMMGFSPSFLGGSGGFLKTGMLEDAWNSDMKTWRHEIQTLEGCIKLQLYCENHVTLKERQSDISIMQPYEQKVEWYFWIFLVVLLELTTLANIDTWQVVNMAHTWNTITLTREAMNSKMAGEIWQRSRRILPAASSYIPDITTCIIDDINDFNYNEISESSILR